MISSVGERAESLSEFALDETQGPIADSIADAEIDVMHLDVSEMTADDLSHRSCAGCDDALPVPQPVIECVPGRLDECKRLRELGAEFSGRTGRAGIGGHVMVVPRGELLADLALGRTAIDPDKGLGLVDEVSDDVPA